MRHPQERSQVSRPQIPKDQQPTNRPIQALPCGLGVVVPGDGGRGHQLIHICGG